MSTPETSTILDVARRAGVSRTTVSRVLNEPDRVAPETLRLVREAAAELNYVPSIAARSLRNGRTDTIALLVGDISQPFHAGLARAVSVAADAMGFSVILSDLGHSPERLLRALERLGRQGVDGVVLATADDLAGQEVERAVRDLVASGVPVVSPVSQPSLSGVLNMQVDFARAAEMGARELLDSGAHHMVLLTGPADSIHSRELTAGFRSVAPDGTVVAGDYTFEGAREAVEPVIRSGTPVDAVLAATMPLALAAMAVLAERGRRVPDDVSLIVCEEAPLAAQVRPSVTTVAVDPELHGAEIIRILTAAIRNQFVDPHRLDPQMVHRETFTLTRVPEHCKDTHGA